MENGKYDNIPRYPAYDQTTNFGFFGWPGRILDMAVRRDDAVTLEEMIRRGWASKDMRVMDGRLLRDWCAERGYDKCAAVLS